MSTFKRQPPLYDLIDQGWLLYNVRDHLLNPLIGIHRLDVNVRMVYSIHPKNLISERLADFIDPFEIQYNLRKFFEAS